MTVATINIPASSCRIEDCGFAKSRAKSPNDDGARVKKLRLIFDLTSKESSEHLDALFPGATDLVNAIAMADGDAVKVAKQKKPPEVSITVRDPQNKAEVFSMIGATCSAPILRIAKRAEKTEMIVVVIGTLTKTQLANVDDYFKADCIGTLQTTQVDLEEQAPAKRGRKLKAKPEAVQVDDADD